VLRKLLKNDVKTVIICVNRADLIR